MSPEASLKKNLTLLSDRNSLFPPQVEQSIEFEEIELTEEDLELEQLKKEYKALGGKLRGKQTLEGLKSKIEALKEEIETTND